MAKPKKQVKGNKVAAYSIKNNQICKLNGSRYVPVTDPQEIATAKIEIAKQLGISELFEQVKSDESCVYNKTQPEKSISFVDGKATYTASENMELAAKINHEIRLLGDKIAQRINGAYQDKRENPKYESACLIDALMCAKSINLETEELIKSINTFIDENL